MAEGVLAASYASGDKFFIDPYKLLPMDRFLPQPKGAAPRGGGGGRGGAWHLWRVLLSVEPGSLSCETSMELSAHCMGHTSHLHCGGGGMHSAHHCTCALPLGQCKSRLLDWTHTCGGRVHVTSRMV